MQKMLFYPASSFEFRGLTPELAWGFLTSPSSCIYSYQKIWDTQVISFVTLFHYHEEKKENKRQRQISK